MKFFPAVLIALFLFACNKNADNQPDPNPDPDPTDSIPTTPVSQFPHDSLKGIIVYESRNIAIPSGIKPSAITVIDVAKNKSIDLVFDKGTKPFTYNYPRLTNDGTRIYFCSDLHGDTSNYDIYSVATDGSDLKRITNTPGVSETFAILSPDESKFVYVALDANGNQQFFLVNQDGSDPRQLTKFDSSWQIDGPLWSNDGNRIFFSLWPSADPGIYVYTLTDSTTTRIVHSEAFVSAVHPVDEKIMYYRVATDYKIEMFSSNYDGSGEQQLTSFGAKATDGAWSPDGKFIAFTSTKWNYGNFDVFIGLTRNIQKTIFINYEYCDKYYLNWR